jgi:transcriptional regulator with XRE-family HTH domain
MNRFARLRFERGLTQQEVADGAHISRATVIRLEQQRHPKPTAVVLSALARFYRVPISDLLPSENGKAAA